MLFVRKWLLYGLIKIVHIDNWNSYLEMINISVKGFFKFQAIIISFSIERERQEVHLKLVYAFHIYITF